MTKVRREKADNFLLPNARTWVVAGDSAETRIFLTRRRFGDWSEVVTLSNPGATTRERDLVSDRPGRAFDSFGKGRHAMSQEETAHQHEIHRFAHEVGGYLNKGMASGKFRHLVLIAEPTFLGYLRPELSAASKKSVLCEISMNPKDHDVERLKSLLT